MYRSRLQITVLIMFFLAPIALHGQGANDQEQLRYQRALQEIEGVIADTVKLDEPLAVVSVKSRVARLVWRYDRARAQRLFMDLWKYIDQQGSEYVDQDEARTVLLKNLFSVNSVLAGKLLKELSARQEGEATLRAQATGKDPGQRRLANISAGLIDHDAANAARLLEQSLSTGVSPTALSVLSRLRERNPILASYVVSQTLERLRSRPTIVALPGLHLLTAYVFPSEPYLAESPEANGNDERLRFQFFSTAYEILKTSLNETDSFLTKEKRYTERDLRFRAIYQGQIALILSALAPRYAPEFIGELVILARRFSGSIPANIADMSNFMTTRLKGERTSSDNPEIAISVAITNGDYDEARRLIDKIEDEARRKALSQLLAKSEFKSLLYEANFAEALSVARRIENVNARVTLLLQLARATYRKDDVSFSRLIVSEARTALANTETDGMRARLLLSIASEVSTISESEAIEMLHSAVLAINSLPKRVGEDEATNQSPSEFAISELNDPRSFMESPELQRAFSSVAQVDFDGALLAAGRINPTSVQLIARLITSDIALTKQKQKRRGAPQKKPNSVGQAGSSF
jgi:hypothetical protein